RHKACRPRLRSQEHRTHLQEVLGGVAMKLVFLTIVLDGMPWVTRHWPEFERLDFDWQWHVVEGAAANTACTSWCAPIAPRLSNDGTTQYLDALASYDHRVILHRKELWQGKLDMVNA